MNNDSPIQKYADRPALELQRIAGLCSMNNCPTVYRTNRGSLVIQGYTVTAEEAGIDLPAGETLIEIPEELLVATFESS